MGKVAVVAAAAGAVVVGSRAVVAGAARVLAVAGVAGGAVARGAVVDVAEGDVVRRWPPPAVPAAPDLLAVPLAPEAVVAGRCGMALRG